MPHCRAVWCGRVVRSGRGRRRRRRPDCIRQRTGGAAAVSAIIDRLAVRHLSAFAGTTAVWVTGNLALRSAARWPAGVSWVLFGIGGWASFYFRRGDASTGHHRHRSPRSREGGSPPHHYSRYHQRKYSCRLSIIFELEPRWFENLLKSNWTLGPLREPLWFEENTIRN